MSYFSGLDFSDLVPDTYIEGICVFVKFTLKISLQIPEDPAYSTPGRIELLFFFWALLYRDTMCNSVFIFQLFRVHFNTILTGS
jgi:hypothetical protein